jgi:hypothetical protein
VETTRIPRKQRLGLVSKDSPPPPAPVLPIRPPRQLRDDSEAEQVLISSGDEATSQILSLCEGELEEIYESLPTDIMLDDSEVNISQAKQLQQSEKVCNCC